MSQFINPTLVTLTAPTCSGKSYLLDALNKSGIFSRIVSTTTRPRREGEMIGYDYDFITMDESLEMEARDEFFEFDGVRYGVTNDQMQRALADHLAPAIVLEPQGLAIYEQKCRERGWDIFKIYVHTTESERLERLLKRTIADITSLVDRQATVSKYADAFNEIAKEASKKAMTDIITRHQRRLLSITGAERRWSNVTSWDAIVPGDDVEKAIEMVEIGIKWRNRKVAPPVAVGAVQLPLV